MPILQVDIQNETVIRLAPDAYDAFIAAIEAPPPAPPPRGENVSNAKRLGPENDYAFIGDRAMRIVSTNSIAVSRPR